MDSPAHSQPDVRADWLGYRYLAAHYGGHAVALAAVFASSAALALAERYFPDALAVRPDAEGVSRLFAAAAELLARSGMPVSAVLLFLQELVLRRVPAAYLEHMAGYSVTARDAAGAPKKAGWCLLHEGSGAAIFVPAACLREGEGLQACLRREIPRYYMPSVRDAPRLVAHPEAVAAVCRDVASGRIPARQVRVLVTPTLSDALTTDEGRAMIARPGYHAAVHCGMDRIYGVVTLTRADS